MIDNAHIKTELHPILFPELSVKMKAIIGYIIEVKATRPSLSGLKVSDDGTMIVGKINGSLEFDEVLEPVSDFKRVWNFLIHSSGFSSEDVEYLEMLPSVTIRNYPG